MVMIRIGHIINPVKVTASSDLYRAQPVTFASMRAACDHLLSTSQVKLFGVGFPDDLSLLPAYFETLSPLERSVMDVGAFRNSRKLPLIADLLRPIDVDYVVYTNVDIALMPYFYRYIVKKIESGSDSLIINRRVIDEDLTDLDEMYAQVGTSHPGYDCFVFRRELLDHFDLGTSCIGANYIGRVLIANLIAFSRKLEIIKDAHLTFHLGNDGAWLTHNYSEFDIHNKEQAYQIINRLIELCDEESKVLQLEEILTFLDDREQLDMEKLMVHPNPTEENKDVKWSLKRKIKFKLRQLLS